MIGKAIRFIRFAISLKHEGLRQHKDALLISHCFSVWAHWPDRPFFQGVQMDARGVPLAVPSLMVMVLPS